MSKISMIAAIGINRELGYGNDLIWKIRNDLIRLKNLTKDHVVVLGRKTYESMIYYYNKSGRPLPGKIYVVITSDQNYKPTRENVIVASSLADAIEKAKIEHGTEEIFIIGGASIFEQAMDRVDRLYLTRINSMAPMADVFFPDYSEFSKIIFSEKHNDDGLEYEFVELER